MWSRSLPAAGRDGEEGGEGGRERWKEGRKEGHCREGREMVGRVGNEERVGGLWEKEERRLIERGEWKRNGRVGDRGERRERM